MCLFIKNNTRDVIHVQQYNKPIHKNIYIHKSYSSKKYNSLQILEDTIDSYYYAKEYKLSLGFHIPLREHLMNSNDIISRINKMYYLFHKEIKTSIYYDWNIGRIIENPEEVEKIRQMKRYWSSFDETPRIYYGLDLTHYMNEYEDFENERDIMNFDVFDYIIIPVQVEDILNNK
jgi:hypothetical protein